MWLSRQVQRLCANSPSIVVVLRFGHVADNDGESWQWRCFELKEIDSGKKSLPSMPADKNSETRSKLDVPIAKLRDLLDSVVERAFVVTVYWVVFVSSLCRADSRAWRRSSRSVYIQRSPT